VAERNLRIAHEVLDAVARRDLEALIELTDPEVEWHSAFAVGGHYEGHDGIRRYVADMKDAWDLVRLEVDHEMAVGEVVVFIGRIQYRGKGSGVQGESESGYVLTFRDGSVVRFRPFQDPQRALESIGLSE
jgi:uncharacterized protein